MTACDLPEPSRLKHQAGDRLILREPFLQSLLSTTFKVLRVLGDPDHPYLCQDETGKDKRVWQFNECYLEPA